jgi:hypothetical protein
MIGSNLELVGEGSRVKAGSIKDQARRVKRVVKRNLKIWTLLTVYR